MTGKVLTFVDLLLFATCWKVVGFGVLLFMTELLCLYRLVYVSLIIRFTFGLLALNALVVLLATSISSFDPTGMIS